MLFFTARLDGNYANLQWQTNDEVNTSHFIVQLSNECIKCKEIGIQQAENNNSTINNCNYKDELSNIGASKIYYRLQMFDSDGKTTFSNVVIISFEDKKSHFKISQNLVKTSVAIEGKNLKQAVVIDNSGKTVVKQTIIDNKTIINIAFLPKGVYTFIMTAIDSKIYAEIIIVD